MPVLDDVPDPVPDVVEVSELVGVDEELAPIVRDAVGEAVTVDEKLSVVEPLSLPDGV